MHSSEKEGGDVAGTQNLLNSSSAESDSSSLSTCYENIPSTFFESQHQAKVYGVFVLCAVIFNLYSWFTMHS